MTEPWKDKWKKIGDLSAGGQGITWLVESQASPGSEAVLKRLKNNKDPQQRARMNVEVASLGLVHTAGGKVPKVLDGNTSSFGILGTQLYFVMEHIPGKTLAQVVGEALLSLDQAAAITMDLATTLAAGHSQNVVHRDLKPDNIIVRGLDPTDVVIVDYGLSFNEEAGGEVTQTGDTFRNNFVDLPESNTPSGNLRDQRSDITALAAVLYFCLTGHRPGHLRDGNGDLPHRRSGFSVRERMKDDHRLGQLEAFFDRAFPPELENRFQTLDEFSTRLQGVLCGPGQEEGEDLSAVIQRVVPSIKQRDLTARKLSLFQDFNGYLSILKKLVLRRILG